jgi:hypothetical protein
MKIFLGGTCAGSNWRDELIPMLKCDYFNPLVPDWTPECQAEEIRQRRECDICLYVLTTEMTGVYSVAEVDDSNKRPNLVFLRFGPLLDRSLQAVANLVMANGAKVFYDLKSLVTELDTER